MQRAAGHVIPPPFFIGLTRGCEKVIMLWNDFWEGAMANMLKNAMRRGMSRGLKGALLGIVGLAVIYIFVYIVGTVFGDPKLDAWLHEDISHLQVWQLIAIVYIVTMLASD